MWTNDSLYLRSYLLIPMGTDIQANGFANSDTGKLVQKDFEVITRQDLSSNKMPKSQSCTTNLSSECDCGKPPTPTDFLSKFDSSLANIKSSLQRIEQKSG